MFKSKTKTKESSPKDQNEKFKDLLVNDLPDGIVIITQDLTQCLFANNSFSALTGHISNSNIQSHLMGFSIHKDGAKKYKSETNLKTLLDFVQYALNNADFKADKKLSCIFKYDSGVDTHGSIPVFEAKVFSKVWDSTPAVSIILHDMTEHYTTTDLKMNLIKREVVSHDLMTPLNGMVGLIEIIKRKTYDPPLLNYLTACINSARLLMNTISSYLYFKQIRTHKFRLIYEKYYLPDILKDVRALCWYPCELKGLFLNLEISESTPEYIITDSDRLTQILINLIYNAVKFTSKGGITVSAKPSDDRRYVEFAVKDTGIGVKDTDQEKLIKGLEDSSTGKHGLGLGHGLTISENLARLLGGDEQKKGLSLESEYEKGSIFSFWIKTKKDEDTDESEDFESLEEDENEGANSAAEKVGQHTMENNPTKF